MAIMTRALPIWAKGCEEEINCRLQFRLTGLKGKAAALHIATSGVYQLFIGGKFIHCGPARAGRNHFRVDVIDLTPYWKSRKTVIAIDVAGYNTENFYIMRQPSFLQVELVDADGQPMSWTGDGRWEIIRTPGYIQKAGRYSQQRTFVEAYRLGPDYNDFKLGRPTDQPLLEAVTMPRGELLDRVVPYPAYEISGTRMCGGGTVTVQAPAEYQQQHPDGHPSFHVFKTEDMEFCAMHAAQDLHLTPSSGVHTKYIGAGEYRRYRLARNATGFLSLRLTCTEPTVLSCLFDEILNADGNLDFFRIWTVNHLRWELQPGTYNLLVFEPYTMRYIDLLVLSGNCSVAQVSLVEFKHPPIDIQIPSVAGDATLSAIAEAAIDTFRQNAVDVFTDCPSRERAGWLCDSFFIARTAFALTGSTAQEKLFLENFLHEKQYPTLPAGMLPMCYPSDQIDGLYIPNWALWLVLQLQEYLQRSDDRELIDRFREKIYDLLRFFAQYENADSLLEDLPGWVFVDWSDANNFVTGVNYPTNMLYSAALRAAGQLYDDGLLIQKGLRIAAAAEEQSFDGKFFRDHAVRREGRLFLCEDCSEACQAYAFFFGIATPEKYARLYKILKLDLGPRRDKNTYPTMIGAGAFVGHYLRLEVLQQNGELNRVHSDLRHMLSPMVNRTGTLWEKLDNHCSCCHGFAAYAVCWLLNTSHPAVYEHSILHSDAWASLSPAEREALQLFSNLPAHQQRKMLTILKKCNKEEYTDEVLRLLSAKTDSE